jgi:hypothetical protein
MMTCPLRSFALTLIFLLCATFPAFAEQTTDFRPYALLLEGNDVPTVARALTATFMSDDDYNKEAAKIRERFKDFERDSQGTGDMGRYLNDRLVIHGLAASNGKVEKIKKGLVWLSFYKEFQQVPPAVVDRFVKQNKQSLLELFQNFDWDRVSAYIRNREWKKPEDEDGSSSSSSVDTDPDAKKTAAAN